MESNSEDICGLLVLMLDLGTGAVRIQSGNRRHVASTRCNNNGYNILHAYERCKSESTNSPRSDVMKEAAPSRLSVRCAEAMLVPSLVVAGCERDCAPNSASV